MKKYKCPCCYLYTLSKEPPGTFVICRNCKWEEDYVQHHDPDYRGGANKMSLAEARKAYQKGIPVVLGNDWLDPQNTEHDSKVVRESVSSKADRTERGLLERLYESRILAWAAGILTLILALGWLHASSTSEARFFLQLMILPAFLALRNKNTYARYLVRIISGIMTIILVARLFA